MTKPQASQSSLDSFFGTSGSQKRPLVSKLPHAKNKKPKIAARPSSLQAFKYNGQSLPAEKNHREDEDLSRQFYEKFAQPGSIEKVRFRSKKKQGAVELKPMAKSIQLLKAKYPDTVLLIEEGYRYKAYAEDAVKVSKALGFFLSDGRRHFEDGHPDDDGYDSFSSVTFPATSLEAHTKKLVDLSHKVGIVEQMESSVLKTGSKPMVRELTMLYTKATYSDVYATSRGHDLEPSSTSNYLMVIAYDESKRKQQLDVGVLAVQCSTGDIIYDSFSDSAMLTELETRLAHIRPCEMAIIGNDEDKSGSIKRLVNNTSKAGEVNYLSVEGEYDETFLDGYFMNALEKLQSDVEKAELSQFIDDSSKFLHPLKKCLHAAIKHLEEFKLDSIFAIPTSYTQFTQSTEMYLSGDTLRSLEVFQNSTDGRNRGTLFSILDNTKTKFGQRMLRKWVAKPLLVKSLIEARVEAVTELAEPNEKLLSVSQQFRSCMDLEMALVNVFYGRCSRAQLYFFITKMTNVARVAASHSSTRYKSALLNDIFDTCAEHLEMLESFYKLLNPRWKDLYFSDEKKDAIDQFLLAEDMDEEENEDILMYQMAVYEAQQGLERYLQGTQKELKIPLKYVRHIEEQFCIGVDAKNAKKVPKDWVIVAKNKNMWKLRSPTNLALLRTYQQQLERLNDACKVAIKRFMGQLAIHYNELRAMVTALANLDTLLALATLTIHGHYVRPKYIDSWAQIRIKQGRHPMAEVLKTSTYIPNDTFLSRDENRAIVLTGPNMGGKSSLVRQVALITIMAQIGSYVPAEEMEIGLFDAIYTRMGAQDNILRGQSTFMIELQECKTIMDAATDKSLVVLDEVGRGTSTIDGMAIAHAVLSHFITELKSLTLFITHYPLLTNFASSFPKIVSNFHMGYEVRKLRDTNDEEHDEVIFTYNLKPGISYRSYGLNVARLARLPGEVIKHAELKSHEQENLVRERTELRNGVRYANFIKSCMSETPSADRIQEILHTLN